MENEERTSPAMPAPWSGDMKVLLIIPDCKGNAFARISPNFSAININSLMLKGSAATEFTCGFKKKRYLCNGIVTGISDRRDDNPLKEA